MKRISITMAMFLYFILLTIVNNLYSELDLPSIEQNLWELEEHYMQNYMKKNINLLLTDFWDKNFIGWPSWAELPVSKTEAETALNKPSKNNIISFKIIPQNIVFKSNIAIVYYLIDVNLENHDKEKSVISYRIIHTWFNENGKWRILGGMSAKK